MLKYPLDSGRFWGLSSGRERLQDKESQLFDDFFRNSWLLPLRSIDRALNVYAPRIAVVENKKEILVTAELPGMDEKDVDIEILGGMLIIKGEKKAQEEHKNAKCYSLELSCGVFQRAIRLPDLVDRDKIEASFKKGILTVSLPKTAKSQAEAKKITIKTE